MRGTSLLQHLDISDDKQFTSDVARQLLGQPGILPALVSLDVSGRKQVCVLMCVDRLETGLYTL